MNPIPPPYISHETHIDPVHSTVREVHHEQDQLGWENILPDRLSNKWGDMPSWNTESTERKLMRNKAIYLWQISFKKQEQMKHDTT